MGKKMRQRMNGPCDDEAVRSGFYKPLIQRQQTEKLAL